MLNNKLKILLINNSELTQTALENFLANFGTVETIHYQSISMISHIGIKPDLVILSGSGDVPLEYSLDKYKDEINFIQTSLFPIIGICFGFECIAKAYNQELSQSIDKIYGLKEINLDENLFNISTVKVWQNHFWYLRNTESLDKLATSESGVEIIKVPNRNIYGLQFHPEHMSPGNDGQLIFEIILRKISLF